MIATKTKWAQFHDNPAPLYVTDRVPCVQCDAHGIGLKRVDVWNNRTTFTTFCYCCHRIGKLVVIDWDEETGTAAQLGEALRHAPIPPASPAKDGG